MTKPYVVDIVGCARCGKDHPIEFREFSHSPISIGDVLITHWGMCPSLDEPILLLTVDRGTQESNADQYHGPLRRKQQ